MSFNRSRWSRICLTATGTFAAGASAQASQVHTVKTGDNISSLARKYHVSTQDIIQANHLTNSDALAEGRKLTIPDPPKASLSKSTMYRPATIHGDRISVRMGPATTARRVDMFDMGAPMVVTASKDNWFQVKLPDGREGWVRSDYVKFGGASTPVPKVAAKSAVKHTAKRDVKVASHKVHLSHHVAKVTHEAHSKHTARNHFAAASHSSHRTRTRAVSESYAEGTNANDVVRTAVAYRGTPYHYGGTGRSGFDCSGFTSYVYGKKGVSLPHNAAAQFSHGSKVEKSDLKPGDLVFFHCGRRGISHVGIFVGNGKFVHASSPHSGGVRVDSLNDGYYRNTFRGARRVKK